MNTVGNMAVDPQSKCYISVNKKPKDIILPHPFNKQLDLLLPYASYELIKDEIQAHISSQVRPPLRYHRMRIPLSAILAHDFFNKYIKIGNVVMLSEGRIDVDNVYCLSDGKLRLSLSKESYERAGLIGKPARFGGGRKGQRWLVEFDLRSDKMMHGTKALERLVWCFSEVLKEPVTFLFCDLNQTTSQTDCLILQKLKAIARDILPSISISESLIVPSFMPPLGTAPDGSSDYAIEAWKEWALDLHEWIGMALIEADRIRADDKVDPYLSNYQVNEPAKTARRIVTIRWRGMIAANYIESVCNDITTKLAAKSLPTEEAWTAITVHGFENSPISWGDESHGSLTGGENCYTLVATFPTAAPSGQPQQFLSFEVIGSQDEHS
ncbi:ribonuclease P 40kDa subunit-domain-containing protein, partial [Kalaharituber pfeilii]